ncbi:u1 snrnp splicing complex subunit [Ophiocordyceps camponoti-floridani]|uniref:U1 snrnp splicing complex subunit n=1 Tax=Ophiocordyceps camponoti-floridani TaxID=2030778 RepID=A0A8H4Q5P6_9HYPO|nr:u1 snrnp splicing complex subunit [Ophiocordyceps camponoti-floridani]
MAAEQRKLLEQLMGNSSSSRDAHLSLDDSKVCRSHIVGTCPHDLFTNTKQDFGPCGKVHSEGLKTEYEALPEREKQRHGLEYDYVRDLHKYIDDCNRRIEAAQKRLEKTPEEIRQTNDLLESIADLEENIKSGLQEIQIFAEQNLVGVAIEEWFNLKVMAQTKADKERDLKALSDTSGPSGHQKLQVCDVCGAYLSRLDNDRRLADHFYGKMHLGYAQMRKAYDAFPKEMKVRARQQPSMMDSDGPGGPRGPKGSGGYRSYRGGGRSHRNG